MIIPPPNSPVLPTKIFEWRDACLDSQSARARQYERRRRYYLTGTADGTMAKHNRLYAHLDLVSSFLYSPDHIRYAIAGLRNAATDVKSKIKVMNEEWNDAFRDFSLNKGFGEALDWSLVYDTMIVKLGWNDAYEALTYRLIKPDSFGVYDEANPDLDAQECFVQTYTIPLEEAVARLRRAGLADKIPLLRQTYAPTDTGDLPAPLAQLIIASTGQSNLGGTITGQAQFDFSMVDMFQPVSSISRVMFQELWVWDYEQEDYASFVLCEPDILISDSRAVVDAMAKATNKKAAEEWAKKGNIFIPKEHPYVNVTPYPMHDYFWGHAHIERLIPLQDWSNERLEWIDEILERQVDPAKVFSGFMGLEDDKADALGGPGAWVQSDIPGAKVEELKPTMPEDLFADYNQIGQLFLEASGLTETVTGKGEQGVRGKGHAKQLATTGSGRIRKTAVALEQPLTRIGDVGLRLLMKNSDKSVVPDDGEKFVLAQMSEESFKLRVAGHSHSPLFSDELKETALVLFRSQAIDQEALIRMLDPPNTDVLVDDLKARQKAQAAHAAANPPPPPKSHHK